LKSAAARGYWCPSWREESDGMPHVKVLVPAGPGSIGTQVLVDGRELTEVRDVHIRAAVGSLVTVTAEVLATEAIDFEADALLHINIVALPGYEIVERTRDDGTKTYRAEQIDDGNARYREDVTRMRERLRA
jgi:hypothetical protein